MVKINTFTPVRRQAPTAEEMDQQIRKAAQAHEEMFLEQMLKQMRATVPDSGGFIPTSNAEKIFREQLDQQYVSQWGDKGGLGLADMIYTQIMEKFGAQMGLKSQEIRPHGPIQLKPQKQMMPIKTEQPNGKTSYLFDLQKMSLDNPEVHAPWEGQLTGAKQVSGDEFLLQLKHSNGLSSQMVFRGMPEVGLRQASVEKPVEIAAGQRLGALSPEAKSFLWTVDVSGSI